jgi:hypothetical protein
MMNRFRVVGGIAHFGPGQRLGLTAKQIADRKHVLTILDQDKKSGDAIVEATGPLQFKVGEIIGLPELEKRLVDILVPVGEPKTAVEEVAVQKHEARQAAAKKKQN